MKIQIKSRYNASVLFALETESMKLCIEAAVKKGADLRGADLRDAYLRGADLRGADLQGADLQGAYLQGADLQGAYLRDADLQGAYLRDADLQGADLRGAYLQGADLQGADLRGAYLWDADLRGADLRGTKGINKHLCTSLRILLDQPGKIRAYKLVKEDGLAPFNGGITYKLKGKYSVPSASTDEEKQCAEGINLATLDWCMREWQEGYRILVAEFMAKDIAAIPTATDGKFRVFQCTIVAEKDLKEIGLVK